MRDGYATVFCSWLVRGGSGYLEEVLARGLKPEIGLQHGGEELPLKRHRELAALIRDRVPGCGVHLPFYDLAPGAAGSTAAGARSRDLMKRALDLAAVYRPDHLIGHPAFSPLTDSLAVDRRLMGGGDGPDAPRHRPREPWLENSAAFWSEVLDRSPARLFLENTSETYPGPLLELLARLPERAALCLDVGHWHYAAEGRRRRNFDFWLAEAAPRLGHLHLHDNDGGSDQHLGLGRGLIDYPAVFRALAETGLSPTFTLEAHRLGELDASLDWLNRFFIS